MKRDVGVGLLVICVVVLGYWERHSVRDMRLVAEAYPSIPSVYATSLDLSILMSPIDLSVDRARKKFLRSIKYPPQTLPDQGVPKSNPISDEILKARNEQGLVHPGDVLGANGIDALNHASVMALGRAIYLSQDRPADTRDFEQGSGQSTPYLGFAQKSAVDQARQIFEITYGPTALQQVEQPEK